MSAQRIYDLVPLGAVIRYSDGTPRPPERFRKKLAAWENNNNSGRLVRKTAARTIGNHTTQASITLHQGDFGSAGTIVLRVHRTFSLDSELTFVVTERPPVGAVRVLNRAGTDAELVYLSSSRADAESWLQNHGYPDAVLDEVTAEAAASDLVKGRVAA